MVTLGDATAANALPEYNMLMILKARTVIMKIGRTNVLRDFWLLLDSLLKS
jgi:hypothetical protein